MEIFHGSWPLFPQQQQQNYMVVDSAAAAAAAAALSHSLLPSVAHIGGTPLAVTAVA